MKRVVVTGASSGIGEALACLLAGEGHELLLVARREAELKRVAELCLSAGALGVETLVLDMGSGAGYEVLRERMEGMGDGEPVLVNNAGLAVFGEFDSTDFAIWEGMVRVNLLGAMGATQAVLPVMLGHGSGLVVNVLSVAAKHAFPMAGVYSATKAGLGAFGRGILEEYRRRGVRVCNVYPGAVNTPLWDGMGGPDRGDMLSARGVAEVIGDVVASPADRVLEEIVLSPPLGIL